MGSFWFLVSPGRCSSAVRSRWRCVAEGPQPGGRSPVCRAEPAGRRGRHPPASARPTRPRFASPGEPLVPRCWPPGPKTPHRWAGGDLGEGPGQRAGTFRTGQVVVVLPGQVENGAQERLEVIFLPVLTAADCGRPGLAWPPRWPQSGGGRGQVSGQAETVEETACDRGQGASLQTACCVTPAVGASGRSTAGDRKDTSGHERACGTSRWLRCVVCTTDTCPLVQTHCDPKT